MKKLLAFLALLLLIPAMAPAQVSVTYLARNSFSTASVAAAPSVLLIASGVGYHQLSWNVTGVVASCTVAVDTSVDGVSWSAGGAITGQTCTTNGQSSVTAAVPNYIRINVTAISGGGSVYAIWYGFGTNPGAGSGTMTSAAIVAGTGITLSGASCSSTTILNCTINSTGGTPALNALTSPTGTWALDMSNGGGTNYGVLWYYPNTISGTSFGLATTKTATGGNNYSSPLFGLGSTYWDGATSSADSMSLQVVMGSGANPTSTLTLGHTGSSGVASLSVPNLTVPGHVTFESTTSTGATGSGLLSFNNGPTFIAPALGTIASGVATNLTGTATALNIGGNAATVTTAVSSAGATYSILAVPSTSGSQAPVTVASFTINPSTGATSIPGPLTIAPPSGGIGAQMFLNPEGTAPTGLSTSGADDCYADSTQHGILCNNNAGTTLPLVQGPASSTANYIASWNSTNGGLLKAIQTVPVGNGGTGATSAAAALINLLPAASEVGDLIYCATYSSGCTSWGLLVGNASGTKYLQETSAGAPSWTTPAGTGTVTVVGAGNLTNTALMTGGGTQTSQTPSATSTMDTSGNVSFAGAIAGANSITAGKSGTAGTFVMSPSSGAFTTTLGSGATATNAFNFPTAVFTNNHMGYCAVSSITCTWTDVGFSYADVVTYHTPATGMAFSASGSQAITAWTDFTFSSHTGSLGASGILDMSAASVTAGHKLPSGAGANPTTAAIFSYDTTNNVPVYGNGTTTKTVVGAATSATATQALFATTTAGAPAYRAIAATDLPAALANSTSINGVTEPSAVGDATATQTIAHGALALTSGGAITTGNCDTVQTVAATGVATTDIITFTPASDPTGITGWGVSATGLVLTLYAYPTSGNVNFRYCNSTATSITPSALTVNWKVTR